MKKQIAIIATLLCMVSCSEVLEDISFDAKPSGKNIYEVGNEITFNFDGNPDYITFYSGEEGRMYEYAGQINDEGVANYGVSVKSMNVRLNTFSYVYKTAGEYNAVFVARNVTFEGKNERVVQMKIKIDEP